MSQDNPDNSRRRFLHRAAAGAIAVPVVGLLGSRGATAADMPKLDPSKGQAKALSYVHDASKASDNPAFKAGSDCANCTHWQGGDSEWGGCAIFPGKSVHRDGWCSAWAKAG